MTRTLVIGYGNTLRGDDGAGVRAAERVAARLPDVDCLCVHELQPELAERIGHYDTVFFLDATLQSDRLQQSTLAPHPDAQYDSHILSPAALLSLSKTVYQRLPRKALLIEIPASKCDFSEQLSTGTEEFTNACVEEVERAISIDR